MEDSVNRCDNEEVSISIKAEPEIIYGGFNWSSENCSLENIDEVEDSNQDINNSYRRSKRTRMKNLRYRSDDDNISLSEKKPEEVYLVQEPLSAITGKGTCVKNNQMTKSKSMTVNDQLGQALLKIGLYDELYSFMKSRGITVEALKYMETRHIDELFKGTRLATKIVFEHRLKNWQNKNRNCEITATQSMYNGRNIQCDPKLSHINGSINRMLPEEEFANLSSVLTDAVQRTINTVLQEFKQSWQKQTEEKSNNTYVNNVHFATIPLRKIKTEQNECASNETVVTDKPLKQILRQSSNKLIKIPDNILLSNQSVDITASPQAKRKKVNCEISVKEILSSCPTGQDLLDEYGKFGLLTPNQRCELVRCIVDFYIRNKKLMTIFHCKELAEEIIHMFPTECLETYFIQDNKSRPPKGKLWDRYNGRKRSIRKVTTLNSGQEKAKQDGDLDETFDKSDWSGMEAICSQMKHISDEKELLEKWRESFAFRRYQLQTGLFCNWKSYFDEYPFCKQQNYAQFIESDLETLYPNLKFNDFLWDEFIENFSTFFSNRIKNPKSKLVYDQLIAMESTSTDYVAIKVIELLHAVLKPHTNKLQSIEDAQRKFTVEVNDLSDLKKVVIERKKQCTENNIQAKPYIAVVGQNMNYSHFSVILDSTGFSCDSYKESLILCFNLYLFFDISFPHESLNVWTFIQKYFFNKPSLVSNPRVESFINDIKGQKLISLDIETNTNGIK